MRVVGGRNGLGWPMATNPESKSYSRRSAGMLLLIGVLAGVTVGGGVGVIAASSTKPVTVCANKKTNVLRYAMNGKCTKTETKVVLNQTSADGMSGAAGAKGDTGAAGAKGDTGAAGAKGDTGAAGTAGADGPSGAAGMNGMNATAGASFSLVFTPLSVCGSNGTTLCAVGVQGPGGGKIFFVDTDAIYGDFDYLEVAPADSSGAAWSTSTANCGLVANRDCQANFVSTSGEALKFLPIGAGRAATAAIVARHDAGSVARASYAAGVADAYTTATASDWFLPSRDELNEVCKYARNTLQVAGASVVCTAGSAATLRGFASGNYWSSSDLDGTYAWSQSFDYGLQFEANKLNALYVRPVRAF